MSKYLIINADDFGYNPQQTKAIDELMRGKLITSTSLMTVAPDAANAAELARIGGYPVGVHLTINTDDSKNAGRATAVRHRSMKRGWDSMRVRSGSPCTPAAAMSARSLRRSIILSAQGALKSTMPITIAPRSTA